MIWNKRWWDSHTTEGIAKRLQTKEREMIKLTREFLIEKTEFYCPDKQTPNVNNTVTTQLSFSVKLESHAKIM